MKLYLVNYDLIQQKDYPKLWDALLKLGAKRVLLSTWVLRNAASATQVRDHLKSFVDFDDRVFITEMVGSNWGSWNALLNLSQF